MDEVAYQIEHSVEADATLAFVWDWRTDITNWDDPPAEFSLDGPFASGSRGTSRLPGCEPLRWQIGEVEPGKSFIIHMALDRATLAFAWRFDAVTGRRTRLTQRIMLSGENANAYARQVHVAFGSSLSDGMNRIARAVAMAAALSHSEI
jgi:hypothetical protein